jgi:ubiquinone/menaquinone biosynthesis C-methylase UbiE
VTDRWARWLLHDRHGGDAAALERLLEQLAPIRDRVLDGADLAGGENVLDVGCGDGLIGFGALERLSAEGRVIFSDVSESLVERCRQVAAGLGELDRCRFLVASADRLDALEDASVDVVTVRSVLIYLDREGKRRAFAEARRVLRPGGRLSVFEPINRFSFPEPIDRLLGFDVGPVRELAGKVKALWEKHAAGSPLLDFDERDLFVWAEQAGFERVRLTLEMDVKHETLVPTRDWGTLLNSSGNPLSPTFGELIEQALTRDEAEALEAHLRPLVEAGAGVTRLAVAYLRAGE